MWYIFWVKFNNIYQHIGVKEHKVTTVDCDCVCIVMVKIHLADLKPGQTVDEWLNLMPVNLTTKSDMGAIRVSVRYLHEVIMPAKEYSSLKEVVLV